MGELKLIKRKEPEPLKPDPYVVKLCEELLEKANKGELRALIGLIEDTEIMSTIAAGEFHSVPLAVGMTYRLLQQVDALDDEEDE